MTGKTRQGLLIVGITVAMLGGPVTLGGYWFITSITDPLVHFRYGYVSKGPCGPKFKFNRRSETMLSWDTLPLHEPAGDMQAGEDIVVRYGRKVGYCGRSHDGGYVVKYENKKIRVRRSTYNRWFTMRRSRYLNRYGYPFLIKQVNQAVFADTRPQRDPT